MQITRQTAGRAALKVMFAAALVFTMGTSMTAFAADTPDGDRSRGISVVPVEPAAPATLSAAGIAAAIAGDVTDPAPVETPAVTHVALTPAIASAADLYEMLLGEGYEVAVMGYNESNNHYVFAVRPANATEALLMQVGADTGEVFEYRTVSLAASHDYSHRLRPQIAYARAQHCSPSGTYSSRY